MRIASCSKCAVACCLSTFPSSVGSFLFSSRSFKFSAQDRGIKRSRMSVAGLDINCSDDWSGLCSPTISIRA
jgi:hypothetical protein